MSQQGLTGNRIVLLSIIGLPVTMILAATWLWYFVARGDIDIVDLLGTSNHGTLLNPPLQLAEQPFENQFGATAKFLSDKHQWTFVIPVTAQCDAECLSTLYTTRQIHVGLGKEFGRVRRVFVSSEVVDAATPLPQSLPNAGSLGAATLGSYLEVQHKGMPLLVLNKNSFRAIFGELQPGTWFLADPAGWMMMSFGADTHYKDVTSDLKFLLKNSGD
jgi:hypothetical protein